MSYEDMCITTWKTLQPVFGDTGAAAIMGNLQAESAMNPKNLQNSYEKKLGYTDDSYTAAVDAGRISRQKFMNDSAGYGLAQWTHHSRKANLYDHLIPDCSIGDLVGQLRFLITEIYSYGGLAEQLKDPKLSLWDKTALVLRKYEKPADQTDANVDRRNRYSQQFLDKYAVVCPDPTFTINGEDLLELRSCAKRILEILEDII